MKIIKNRLTNNLAWLCNYEIWILLEKLIKKTGLGKTPGRLWNVDLKVYIYNLSKYKIIQIKNVINRSRDSMAWNFCSLSAAMLCILFRRCVRAFRASIDGERSIETSHEVCSAFCDREWVGRNICKLCRNGGPRELKKTWLTLKTLDMEVKIDLYGFVTFFSR